MNQLLHVSWKEHFESYEDKSHHINSRLAGHKKYIQHRFDALKGEYAGQSVEKCPSCHFDSAVVKPVEGDVSSVDCFMCRFVGYKISIACPNEDCGRPVNFYSSLGFRVNCSHCDHEIDSSELDEALNTDPSSYNDPDPLVINCPACLGHGSVIPHHSLFICLSCLEVDKDMGICGWCNEGQLGGVGEHSGYIGCEFCDGNSSLLND